MYGTLKTQFHFFKTFICTIAFCIVSAANGNTIQSKLEGIWYSPEWEYGFRIEDHKGLMTSWNNTYNPDDSTKKGDVILKITEFTNNGFKGVHTFYDGSLIDVVAIIVDSNVIELSGRREVWKMYRQPE